MKELSIENRKARFDYEWLDTWIAGMVLSGTEVKSIRAGMVDFNGAWCEIVNGELICHSLYVKESNLAFTHKATQDRKLLITKKEIKKITRIMDKGLTLVPVRIFCAKSGYLKIVIALCKGKKNWDKRETIKKRDLERETHE